MNTTFGPWTTTLHNMPPRLDTFWKRRLVMVAALKPIEPRRIRVTLLLLAVGIALWAVPTLLHSSARADQQAEEKRSAQVIQVKDRDRQLEELEHKVEELLREVKALRAERTRADRAAKSNAMDRIELSTGHGRNCLSCHASHANPAFGRWGRQRGLWPNRMSQNCKQCHMGHTSDTLFLEENQRHGLWPRATTQDCGKCHSSVHPVPWKSSVKK